MISAKKMAQAFELRELGIACKFIAEKLDMTELELRGYFLIAEHEGVAPFNDYRKKTKTLRLRYFERTRFGSTKINVATSAKRISRLGRKAGSK